MPDKPWQIALLVFLTAFCLYALTAARDPQGYEAETNAVAEGVVLHGSFTIDPQSPLRDPNFGSGGQLGKDGRLIGRAGLPSVLEKVPFYAVGNLGDDVLASSDDSTNWRMGALTFAEPFAAAVAVAFFFLVVLRMRRSIVWALAMAGVFALASLAWPYSKIGMETVLMTAGIGLLAAVLYARESASWHPWAATGFAAGAVLADKPYGILAVAAIVALLIEPLRRADGPTRRRLLLAALVPLALWGLAYAGYNLSRTGSILETGRSDPELTLAAPFNAIGFMVSPGKGLLLYSPVVILGLLGLRPLWRADARLAMAIVGAFLGGLVVVACLRFWSDETWGPRYVVWVAWLLLLPVPYWAATLRRVRVLAAVAAVGVAVQLLAVLAPPTALVRATRDLTGQPIFQRGSSTGLTTPFGRDPIRWIPELSPLLFQTKLLLSFALVHVGGPAITTTYEPFEGPDRRVTLDRATLARYDFERPHIWWIQREAGGRRYLAVMFLVVGVFGAIRIRAVWRSHAWRQELASAV